jgi:uncharacterized membrane protein YoaK (UPF0700 family)
VPAPAQATFGPIDDEEWAVSDRRYWLLVLLIPLFGVFFVGGFGPQELALWLVLAVTWLVAFVWDDRLDAKVPLAVVGAVVVLGAGIAVYNHTTMEGSHVTVTQRR